MTGALLATIPTSWAVLITAAGTADSFFTGVFLFKPQRDAVIAQAAEHATNSLRQAFDRLDKEFAENRIQLGETRSELGRAIDREQELQRRLGELERTSREEMQALRVANTELAKENTELRVQLAETKAAPV